MLVIEVTHQASSDAMAPHKKEHKAFRKRYLDAGVFVASGTKEDATGGIILARTDIDRAQSILQEDPYIAHNLSTFSITPFSVEHCHEGFQMLLDEED